MHAEDIKYIICDQPLYFCSSVIKQISLRQYPNY